MKNIFSEQAGFSQLIILLLLLMLGTIVASVLALVLSDAIASETELLRWTQFVASICMFLFPALFFAYLCSPKMWTFLRLNSPISAKAILYGVIGLLLLQPSISLSNYINQCITLPSFLSPLEAWMREKEMQAEALIEQLLLANDSFSLAKNVLVISLAAGLTEEVFFRGALQRILERFTSNPHLVIWVAAAIFSAIHLQFFGFFPRLFLGAFLGYLLYWTGSMWVPILVHALNNLLSVFVMSFDELKEYPLLTDDISADCVSYYVVASVLGLTFIVTLQRLCRIKTT